MQENQDLRQNLRERIMHSYVAYVGQVVGENSELANGLATGLDEILARELGLISEEAITAKGDNYPILGPIVDYGNRYTTQEVLEMTVNEFLGKHRESARRETGISMMRYFNAMFRPSGLFHDQSRDETKIKGIIEVTPNQSMGLHFLGSKTIEKVNQYFQNNYGISLGTKVG
ncbi:MAG: hypothetical protein IH934_00870 [Nanoarchaeota archaeon]|nr:hypothetical protein [Nanoarchaeota archaeon]